MPSPYNSLMMAIRSSCDVVGTCCDGGVVVLAITPRLSILS